MKILLVGFNTRALAESGVRAGFNVVSADCFGDLDHRMYCRAYSVLRNGNGVSNLDMLTELVLTLLGRENFDAVVCASGFENRPDCVAVIQKRGARLISNTPAALANVRNAKKLNRMLRAAGFFVPRIVDFSEIAGTNRRASNVCWLKKPALGGGGRGISFVQPGERIGQKYIMQEFIPGIPCSFAFLSDGKNSCVLGISEQLIGSKQFNGREFGYGGNIFPLDVSSVEMEKIWAEASKLARWLTRTFDLKGLNGVDFIYDGDRCWIIEVNPRYTASMELMEMAFKVSLLKLHVNACSGKLPVRSFSSGEKIAGEKFWGKKIVYAPRDAEVATFNSAAGEWANMMRSMGVRDIPFPGERIGKGSPVATAIASGKTRSECVAKLDELSLQVWSYMRPVKKSGGQ